MTISVIILSTFLDDNLAGTAFLNHDSCFFAVPDGFRFAFADVTVCAADILDARCRLELEFSVPLFEMISGFVNPVNSGKEFGRFPLAPFAVVGSGPVGISFNPDCSLDFDAVQSVCLTIDGLLLIIHTAAVNFVFEVCASGLFLEEIASSVFDGDFIPVNLV